MRTRSLHHEDRPRRSRAGSPSFDRSPLHESPDSLPFRAIRPAVKALRPHVAAPHVLGPVAGVPTGSRRDGERGTALLVAIVVLFVLMAVGSSSMSVLLSEQQAARKSACAENACGLAEAGIDLALYEVRLGVDFGSDGIGNVTSSLPGGSYAVTIAPDFVGPGEYVLHAVGSAQDTRRAIETIIAAQPAGAGLISRVLIRLSGSGMIDSYDSSLSSYANQIGPGGYAGRHGDVRTNGDITLSGGAVIYGDATYGPTGSFKGSKSKVLGTTSAAPQPQEIVPFVYAPPLPATGKLSVSTTFADGSYRFTELSLSSSDTITIAGNVTLYVDGPVKVSGKAKIVLEHGARLNLRHGSGDLHLSGGGALNIDEAPANLTLSSATKGKVHLSGHSKFFGTVNAPDADLELSGGSDFFGAAIANTMTLSGGGSVHYDTALPRSGPGEFRVRVMRPVGV